MSITFEQVLAQANVALSPRGLYLRKEDRNCEATARLLVAVRALIDGHNGEVARLNGEVANGAKRESRLAARNAELEGENSKLTRVAIGRGLEATDLPQITRDHVMNVG